MPLGWAKQPGRRSACRIRDVIAFGVEDLDAIVHGVGNVDVPVFIQRNLGGSGEIARRGELVMLAAGSDAAFFFERVGIVDHNLVRLRIHYVELAVLGVDGDPDGIDQAVLDLLNDSILLVEDQHAVQFAIGNEQAIVIVERDGVDHAESGFIAVADKRDIPGLGVEDEDRAHLLVGDVKLALGIDAHSVRCEQLERERLQMLLVIRVLHARKTVHP